MKITHVLGHNSNWNIDSYLEHNIGDYFLITAYTHGTNFRYKNAFKKILNNSMIDLQFYGKKSNKGKLSNFPFHPSNVEASSITSEYFNNCVKKSIQYQRELGFKNIIIPHFYENEEVSEILTTIKTFNKYIKQKKRSDEKYFMTLPFANHIIIDKEKVEEILFECTDQNIHFDGYFVVSENKPEFRKKLTVDIKVIRNISKVLKTLKLQEFETIYAYSNWDAIIHLAVTDIDYITIGSYENLRNFDIKRYTEDQGGGGSKGYYFSDKLLNMIKADAVTLIKDTENLNIIKNDRNIFSDIILKDGYKWNIHKPDVNKNYLLSISKTLRKIASIEDFVKRKKFVNNLIDEAIANYDLLESRGVYLDNESSNYHLNIWKTHLANV